MPVEIHETQFHLNRRTGLYRGLCACGWVKFGTLIECQSAAAVHDLDWVEVPAGQPPSAGAQT